ncbi:MAG: NHL repeat-containing protein [Nitrospirota bacterium]
MKKSTVLIAFIFALSLIGASGCMQPLIKPDGPIVYPPGGGQPRVVYLRSIWGAVGFQEVSIFDRIFGVSMRHDLEKPFDVYVRGSKVFISDTATKVVHIIDEKERTTSLLGGGRGAGLQMPMGVNGLPDGTLFVADAILQTVVVFDPAGNRVRTIGKKGELKNPAGIAVNKDLGRLYIADVKDSAIKVYSLKGEFLFRIGTGGEGDGQLFFPSFVAVDRRNGDVYVSDTNNFRVQVFDKDGKYLRKFGGLGDAPGLFSRPKGLGVDSEGHAYVVEATYNNFQLFNEKGEVLMWVGNGGSAAGGLFLSPAGLYVDEDDKIYVVDTLNRRVQVFQYLSEAWKKAHPEEYTRYQSK